MSDPHRLSFLPPMEDPPRSRPSRLTSIGRRLKDAGRLIIHHAKHSGVGIVCSVAYFDPGNWGVDLQAGSQFGYALLFVVLLSGLFAVYLQVLASRLGCVTGIDLASHNRLLLYNRPRHTLLYRWFALYPLYFLSEAAIIATDLAELLGSAIALCMLFPKLELWQGVLITGCDVLLLLGLGDPLRGKPFRTFELMIAAMVFAVLICMVVIITKVNVHWASAFEGYIPSKAIFAPGGVYTSVGIIGATVMPHSLFLGSNLATQDRISFREDRDEHASSDLSTRGQAETQSLFRRFYYKSKYFVLDAFRKPPLNTTAATRHSERQNNSYEFVRAHIYHGTVDMVGSLLGCAVMINSLLLTLASAVFFYGSGRGQGSNPTASLFDAYDLIHNIIGKPAATLFAVGLLAAGQSSSLIATLAGQAVSEGFLQWKVSAVVRRLLTRLLAIIPSMTVAIVLGRPGINALLVASQVVLSIILPFVIFPLLYFTGSKSIMSVRKRPLVDSRQIRSGAVTFVELPSLEDRPKTPQRLEGGDKDIEEVDMYRNNKPDERDILEGAITLVELPLSSENAPTAPRRFRMASRDDRLGEVVDFSNGTLAKAAGALIWLLVVAANLYVIVELGLGVGG